MNTKLHSSSFLILLAITILLLASVHKNGVVVCEDVNGDDPYKGDPNAGEPLRCIRSWDCTTNEACKRDCSQKFPAGRGFCKSEPPFNACLCTFNCPPPPPS